MEQASDLHDRVKIRGTDYKVKPMKDIDVELLQMFTSHENGGQRMDAGIVGCPPEDAGEAEVLMNEDTLDECEVVLNNEPLQQDEEFATLEI